MLEDNNTLKELYLRWNLIKGEGSGNKEERFYGAQSIFRVLYEKKLDNDTYEETSEYKNDSLKVLDLSFNSIGGSMNVVGVSSSKSVT